MSNRIILVTESKLSKSDIEELKKKMPLNDDVDKLILDSGTVINVVRTGESKEIKHNKRDDNVYIFKVPRAKSADCKRIGEDLKKWLPKDARVIVLGDGIDYIPPDNEELSKRIEALEERLNKGDV